jgi:inosine/xanthosine triphosphatase
MKRVVVGSKNPVKINAALGGFRRMFPDEAFTIAGVPAPSGVSDQPRTDAEARQGAWNRATTARRSDADAEFFVGIEGGVEDKQVDMEAFAWVVVVSGDGRVGRGRTGTFVLPSKVAELVREGRELGEADDLVFGTTNSKRRDGAVGILTDGVLDRTAYYTEAVVLALIPFKKRHLYAAS